MGTPLRKERPQDELTTADLARAQRPEPDTTASDLAIERKPLLAPDDVETAPSNVRNIPVRVESGPRDLATNKPGMPPTGPNEHNPLSNDLLSNDSVSNDSPSYDSPGNVSRGNVLRDTNQFRTATDSVEHAEPFQVNRPGQTTSLGTAGGSTLHEETSGDGAPLIPSGELEELRGRWREVQTAFVDEPRSAVEQADGLVASAMKRLAEVFADERSKLEQQWDRGDNVSTEDLRVALQRYRTFFHRLLSV